MSRPPPLSEEQEVIRELFEPLTHIGHRGARPVPQRSDKHFSKRPRKPLTFGLQDDAALALLPDNKELVLSKDMLVEGVHFTGHESPGDIASKALRTNLSDIASKGAIPYGYLLGIAVSEAHTRKWLAAFANGLKRDQKEYTIPLLGGDLVSTKGPLTISITILGLSDSGSYVSRDGAQDGDKVYVSGTIGDAYLGLKLALGISGQNTDDDEWIADIDKSQVEYFLGRYQLPQPRTQISSEIAQFCTSSMDISDGLVIDLDSLCRASNMGAKVEIEKIPLSQGLEELTEKYTGLKYQLITGGDDYEILCTVPNNLSSVFEQACQHKGVEMTQIGVMEKGSCLLIGPDGKEVDLNIKGYSHLSSVL